MSANVQLVTVDRKLVQVSPAHAMVYARRHYPQYPTIADLIRARLVRNLVSRLGRSRSSSSYRRPRRRSTRRKASRSRSRSRRRR